MGFNQIEWIRVDALFLSHTATLQANGIGLGLRISTYLRSNLRKDVHVDFLRGLSSMHRQRIS